MCVFFLSFLFFFFFVVLCSVPGRRSTFRERPPARINSIDQLSRDSTESKSFLFDWIIKEEGRDRKDTNRIWKWENKNEESRRKEKEKKRQCHGPERWRTKFSSWKLIKEKIIWQSERERNKNLFDLFLFYKGEKKQSRFDCLLSWKGVALLIDVFDSVDDVIPMISFDRRVCEDVNVLTESERKKVERSERRKCLSSALLYPVEWDRWCADVSNERKSSFRFSSSLRFRDRVNVRTTWCCCCALGSSARVDGLDWSFHRARRHRSDRRSDIEDWLKTRTDGNLSTFGE